MALFGACSRIKQRQWGTIAAICISGTLLAVLAVVILRGNQQDDATKSFNDLFKSQPANFRTFLQLQLLAARSVGESINVQPADVSVNVTTAVRIAVR